MLKWVNKAIVFTITVSGVYLFSNKLSNLIQPYLRHGLVRSIQLYTFGFCLGYVGAMTVDNVIKLGVVVLKNYL